MMIRAQRSRRVFSYQRNGLAVLALLTLGACSTALAFGSTTVRMGDNLDWIELAEQSHSPQFTKTIKLRLGETTELGSFPREPYAIVVNGPRIERAPEATRDHRAAKDSLHRELAERLASAPSREVLLRSLASMRGSQDRAVRQQRGERLCPIPSQYR